MCSDLSGTVDNQNRAAAKSPMGMGFPIRVCAKPRGDVCLGPQVIPYVLC